MIYKDIAKNPVPLIKNGQIQRSGIVRYNQDLAVVEELSATAATNILMSIKEFTKMLRINPPCKASILMVEDKLNSRTLFCNLEDEEIRNKVKSNAKLFPSMDRIVQYMIINGIESVVFDAQGVFVRNNSSEGARRDSSLDGFNRIEHKKLLAYTALQNASAENINVEDDIDVYLSVQGTPLRFMKWRDLTGDIEVSIKIETPEIKASSELNKIFSAREGFLMVTRELAQSIPSLIESEGGFRRIAFKGFGPLTLKDSQNICSYFGPETPIEVLRSRLYDVFIINIEKLDDYREILALPTNKLCILVHDFNNVTKAINIIKTLFGEDLVIRTHIVSNLQAIIAGGSSKDSILLDDWSREMLKYENDINTIMTKINQPFIIRNPEDMDLTEEIDIKKEISLIFETAKEMFASNIDICPGSPIRLYTTKTKYVPYSNVTMTPNLVEMMLLNMLSPSEISKFYKEGELDTSYSLPQIGRYRLGIVLQRSSPAISIRKVPSDIPSPRQLNLPEDFVTDVVNQTKGFTLIVGEPNSGKTVTFNCLIDRINEEVGGIIFLMGSPIEYTHRHKKALVIQVEVGKDIETYTQGIAKSLRMNTSILGFEELRTQAEFAALGALINAPNTLYMTMHSSSCRKAAESLIERLSETGISEKKAQEDVANALNYIIYQKLVDYKGKRVLIYEKMKATEVVKNLIRNGNYNQIENAIATQPGCESLDRVILKRLEDGDLDFDSVKNYVRDKRFFMNKGYNF